MTLRAPLLECRLKAVIAYIREHVHEPINVEDFAAQGNLSRAHLFALFRGPRTRSAGVDFPGRDARGPAPYCPTYMFTRYWS